MGHLRGVSMLRQVRCECGYIARGRSDYEVIALILAHVARDIHPAQTTTQPSSTQVTVGPAAADPEDRPTQRIPPVQTTTQPSSTQATVGPAAADPEDRPTQRIPPVQTTTQPSSTQATVDPAAANPGAAATEKVDEGMVDEGMVDPAAAGQEPWMALGLSRFLGDMELMIDSIRSGTGKVDVEKADPVVADTQQVDTDNADPTTAEPTDTQQVDTDNANPTTAEATDTQQVDTDNADPTTADTEKTDTALTGPDDADTLERPPVGAVLPGGRHPPPQGPEQQVLAPVPVQNPAEKRRFRSLALAATALAALLIGTLFFANREVGGVTAQSAPTVTATATIPVSKSTNEPSDEPTDIGGGESTIQLEDLADSTRPFEAVRIQGTYRGGADTFLRVQRWERDKWLDFPLPTKTDQSGQFITQAEFGQPGRYWLRVIDPDSGVRSETFVVVIKG
jgi:hypothetical protein